MNQDTKVGVRATIAVGNVTDGEVGRDFTECLTLNGNKCFKRNEGIPCITITLGLGPGLPGWPYEASRVRW